ncbi:MAG: DUF192 domain-containing protein [Polyangiaceae bacterium]
MLAPSALAVLLAFASCNRAPAEPVVADIPSSASPGPTTLASDMAVAPSVAVGPRPIAPCLRETSSTPPPAVTAAAPTRCPKDPAPNSFLATRTIDVAGTALETELAQTDAQSERGLMYRMNMGENHGMIFDLHVTKDHEFWMHNTCIPLDMMYIDETGRIVGILENVPVLNDEPRSVGCPSRWVLEVNAGWSRRHGVHAGDKVRLPTN